MADEYAVLRVATNDVQSYCTTCFTADADAIYIHLGVSGSATSVCLEECAYNNMTFRAPDEAGYQPQEECIVPNCDYDAVLRSNLPLEKISAQVCSNYVENDALSPPVTTSTDPGRYLCNYIYFLSLKHFEKANLPKHCVFIHVPPVEVMPLETTIEVVSQCIMLIREHCAINSDLDT